jgi:hypothetical protein
MEPLELKLSQCVNDDQGRAALPTLGGNPRTDLKRMQLKRRTVMLMQSLAKVMSHAFKFSRKTVGLLLVFAACSGTAYGRGSAKVPEIDPGTASSAVSLLVAGVLMITDRVRRK